MKTAGVAGRIWLYSAFFPDSRHECVLSHSIFIGTANGPALCHPQQVSRAAASLSYVLNHENRPHLDEVFEEMSQLGKEHSFGVTVKIVPTVVRLHGTYYEHLLSISEEAHFIQYVAALSDRIGFSTLNMLDHLKPFGGTELLCMRDDDHWNERGHQLAAEIIEKEALQL